MHNDACSLRAEQDAGVSSSEESYTDSCEPKRTSMREIMRRHIMPHWYKEKRTNHQRDRIYRRLRKCGFSICLSRRARDWSDGHIGQLIRCSKEGEHEIRPQLPQDASTRGEGDNAVASVGM